MSPFPGGSGLASPSAGIILAALSIQCTSVLGSMPGASIYVLGKMLAAGHLLLSLQARGWTSPSDSAMHMSPMGLAKYFDRSPRLDRALMPSNGFTSTAVPKLIHVSACSYNKFFEVGWEIITDDNGTVRTTVHYPRAVRRVLYQYLYVLPFAYYGTTRTSAQFV